VDSREDPQVKEQREARRKARAEMRNQQLQFEKELAEDALARAEEIRQKGNDDYRQGQLPGNARSRDDFARAVRCYTRASTVLTECLDELKISDAEIVEVKKQRGLLFSNAAQVQLMLEKWEEAAELAENAIKDDPTGLKPKYRMVRAQVGLQNWEVAAKVADEALQSMKSRPAKEVDDLRLEFWALAETISKELPDFKWSVAKPMKEEKVEVDFEKRIVGKWDYGPPGKGQYYEIILEKWGALYWKEGDMRIDLLRKGKLRWRGEYEMVSGMVLLLSYEPGADIVVTEFIPPPDVPEEQKWTGPTKFTAKRLAEPEKAPEPEIVTDLDPPPPPEEVRAIPQHVDPEQTGKEAEEEAAAAQSQLPLPQNTPQSLWLSGLGDCDGQYDILTEEEAAPVSRSSGGPSKAVYCRQGGTPVRHLWYRGGNWVVTELLNLSSLASPALGRCPEPSGRCRHPMEVRRAKWWIRKGRNQEEMSSTAKLEASPTQTAAHNKTSQTSSSTSSTLTTTTTAAPTAATLAGEGKEEDDNTLPPTLYLAGREGTGNEVNGRYEMSHHTWAQKPVYVQVDPPMPFDQEKPLSLFFDHGYWAIARGVSSLPKAVARCHPLSDSKHPADVQGAPWEFQCDNSELRAFMSTNTRKFMVDRWVKLETSPPDVSQPCTSKATNAKTMEPEWEEKKEELQQQKQSLGQGQQDLHTDTALSKEEILVEIPKEAGSCEQPSPAGGDDFDEMD